MVQLRVATPVKKRRDAVKPKFQAALDAGNIQEVIDKLTVRQRRFVEEYVVDFDGTAAVLRAGYNVKPSNANRLSHEMLQHPGIKAAIDQVTIERAADTTLKPDYVMKKIKRTIEKAETEGNHSAVLRGCELMARALGMFVERKEISGPNGDAVKIQQVKEAADAFTSAVAGLIERGREDGSFVIVGPEC
jgi:hypothetical protein